MDRGPVYPVSAMAATARRTLGRELARSAVSAMLASLSGCSGARSEAPRVDVEVPEAPSPAVVVVPPADQGAQIAAPEEPEEAEARSPPNWDGKERVRRGSCCKGKNECKGKGNCKTDQNDCKGKNECKGQGGCKGVDCDEASP
jgi:hypothetical protein